MASMLVALFASPASFIVLKSWIVWPGLGILIPAMAATGISGILLARKNPQHPLVQKKQKTMKLLVINGLCILTPCALFLDAWAAEGSLHTSFYLVQGVEFLAGGMNFLLILINIRRGFDLRTSSL
ncbi:hypothetical protein [Allopseudospirillum japonicum]|uniref:hypothetical protein n=1 Tax=Allopseudospirillum japonicum TaxID=64971 RepID=UPI00116002BE|nr:hypothetical protein [Allopseudospirillum japonicum]